MQSGTGILLDMGHAVTVNSIGLVLGAAAGADVQVRLGDAADLDSMSTAANMPKSPGKYQVSLYKATVDGHA